jgi:hypothetical protein
MKKIRIWEYVHAAWRLPGREPGAEAGLTPDRVSWQANDQNLARKM